MKNRIALISAVAVAVVVSAGLGIRANADHRDITLRASLRGLNEVPPTASPATATLRATLDERAQTITFTLDFRNLTLAPAAAHIHFGPPAVNGGVMVFFCGGGGKPACPTTTSGTVTGTIAAADVVGPAAQGIAVGDFASVVRAIRTGNSYANMHNERFPAGELRGRVIASGFGDGDRDNDDD
jgi:CHRD domain